MFSGLMNQEVNFGMDTYKDIIHCQRPSSRKYHMSTAHRAKQFAPFAALKGYEEAIQRQELVYVPFNELSDEQKNKLDQKLHMISCKDLVTASYFLPYSDSSDLGMYHTITGTVEVLDLKNLSMQIDDTVIAFSTLTDLEF